MPAGYKILLDTPAKEPVLGFDEVAWTLADFIRESDPQFAIGLFGGWGSGKTTLMRAIAHRLPADTFIKVDFSAWRYEKEEHLIVPLLDTVRDELVEWAKRHPAAREEARDTAGVIAKAARAIVAGLSIKVGIAGAVEASYDANKSLAEWKDSDDAADVPQSFYHASFKALRGAFKNFVGGDQTRRIVVFVDDLDRCLPEGALDVLESMKLFFDLPGFVFVVGLDQEVVEHVIDVKYAAASSGNGNGRESPITGADYIKKIFQLPYTLAPVTTVQLTELLDSICANAALTHGQEREIRAVVQPHLEHCTEGGEVNPREVKRYINAYTVSKQIRQDLRADPLLALQTIAFRSDWRAAREALFVYRHVFVDAVHRQVTGEATALEDLDPELATIPDSFFQYISTAPANSLLSVDLDTYLYAGEATRSTRGRELLDLIHQFASVRRELRALRDSIGDRVERAGVIVNALGSIQDRVPSAVKGSSRGAVINDLESARDILRRFANEDENRNADQWGALRVDADKRVRRNIRRLVDLYLAGDVGGRVTSAGDDPPTTA